MNPPIEKVKRFVEIRVPKMFTPKFNSPPPKDRKPAVEWEMKMVWEETPEAHHAKPGQEYFPFVRSLYNGEYYMLLSEGKDHVDVASRDNMQRASAPKYFYEMNPQCVRRRDWINFIINRLQFYLKTHRGDYHATYLTPQNQSDRIYLNHKERGYCEVLMFDEFPRIHVQVMCGDSYELCLPWEVEWSKSKHPPFDYREYKRDRREIPPRITLEVEEPAPFDPDTLPKLQRKLYYHFKGGVSK